MIKEVIATGETIEEAMAAARAELNAPEDADVSFEALEQPKKKTFGLFGGTKAKVRAFYELPEPKAAPERRPAPQKAPAAQKPAPKAAEPVQKPRQERPVQEKPAEKPAEKAAEKPAENKPQERPQAAPKAPVEYKEVAQESIAGLIDYLKSMLTALGLGQVQVEAKTANDELFLHVDCTEDYGILIGRRGETLDAVQYLMRLYANRNAPQYTRVSVNVGNYREKREHNLRQLAQRTANQVLRYGRQTSLDPMNPYERRLIHTAIQEIKGVTSYSVGSDADRRVVVALQEGFSPSNARGRDNRERDHRGGYNRNRDNNRAPRENKPAQSRATAKDAATVSLYGKIEPKKQQEQE